MLRYVNSTKAPQRAHEVLQELRDISSMAMEYFDEKIVPILKRKLPGSDVSGRLIAAAPGTFLNYFETSYFLETCRVFFGHKTKYSESVSTLGIGKNCVFLASELAFREVTRSVTQHHLADSSQSKGELLSSDVSPSCSSVSSSAPVI